MTAKVICGDMMGALNALPDCSVDTVITDPPYGLKFKKNKWDYKLPSVDQFSEILRVLKPGGTMMCFGGTRTFHRAACNIEDAGFYISDCISWVYHQGFPKSVDIAYMIDKNRGRKGKTVQKMMAGNPMEGGGRQRELDITAPASEDADQWNGWGTALKPSWEPIIVCNKPIEGNYDDNALNNGVAGYWIDGARVGGESFGIKRTSTGRWPANFITDDLGIDALNHQSSKDNGQFFFCPKPSKKEKGKYNTHDTVKPVDLIRYLCRLTRTPEGGIVLDPFAGSGTTGIAAELEGRDSILIEREVENVEIINKRIADIEIQPR